MTYEEIMHQLILLHQKVIDLGSKYQIPIDAQQEIVLEIIKLKNEVQRTIDTQDDLK